MGYVYSSNPDCSRFSEQMFTPNDQGYYQPYIPQQGQQPRQQEYQFPYIPPPPPLSNSGIRPIDLQQQPQSYELQNMQSNNQDNNENIVKNYQKSPNNRAHGVIDEYNTPTNNGEHEEEEQKQNKGNSMFNMKTDFPKESYFKPYENKSPINQIKSYCIELRSGVLKLQELQGIYIKQKFDVAESVTSCERPNVYKVFPADCNGDIISNQYIFKCKEKSSFCARNCVPGSRRPFNMVVKNRNGQINQSKDGAEDSNFLLLRRPFKCTCLCISRPELEVLITESGINKLLGKIIQPYYFCSAGVQIQDLLGNLKYIIEGTSYCMPAILCGNCPCRSCQEAMFIIKSPEGIDLSYITKRTAGCLKSCASDKSNFGVTFPHNANPEDKVLIMAATLFLDYSYFEESVADKHGDTSHISFISDDQKISYSIPLNNMN